MINGSIPIRKLCQTNKPLSLIWATVFTLDILPESHVFGSAAAELELIKTSQSIAKRHKTIITTVHHRYGRAEKPHNPKGATHD